LAWPLSFSLPPGEPVGSRRRTEKAGIAREGGKNRKGEDIMKLKWDEEQKQFVNAETGEVFTMPDGEPLEIEGMKTQADIQAAINSKTKKHQEELGTLKKALEDLKARRTVDFTLREGGGEEAPSEEEIRQLRELGYL